MRTFTMRSIHLKKSACSSISVSKSKLYIEPNPFSIYLVFIVQYTPSQIHAIDGLGHGLILMPVNGNLILKIYDETDKVLKETY